MIRTVYLLAICSMLIGCSNYPQATSPVINATNSPILDPIKVVQQPKPPFLVKGRVHVNGTPVKGMLVEAYTGSCFSGPVVAKTVTDAKGEFGFKDMKPETYFIGLNEFRGSGKLLPIYSSTCGKGRYFSGKDSLDFQLLIAKR